MLLWLLWSLPQQTEKSTRQLRENKAVVPAGLADPAPARLVVTELGDIADEGLKYTLSSASGRLALICACCDSWAAANGLGSPLVSQRQPFWFLRNCRTPLPRLIGCCSKRASVHSQQIPSAAAAKASQGAGSAPQHGCNRFSI